MAGKNITIAGATFNGVPSIDVPVSGGGTASFVEISDTTAQAADVASGKYFYTAAGVKTEGTASGGGGVTVESLSVTQNGTYTAPTGKAYSPVTVNVSGGGGASNIVTGTFKGATTGAAMDISLPYTGSGYPIAVMIFPSMADLNTFASLVQRYAIREFFMEKTNRAVPDYAVSSASKNYGIPAAIYKNSASDPNIYAVRGASTSSSVRTYQDAGAEASANLAARLRSNTKLSVYIASTSYGFAANIEYTYYVIYSE